MQAELVEILGGTPGQRHQVNGEAVLGRGPSCQIVIASDPGVSRQHAKVFWSGSGWMVTGLGSKNGTRVNGQSLTGPTTLNPGDTVQISQRSFRLEVAGASQLLDPTVSIPSQASYPTMMSPAQGNPTVMNPISPRLPQESNLAGQYQIPGQGQTVHQQVVIVQGGIPKWLWIVLAVVALGPCGIFCLLGSLLSVMPFILVIGGMIAGIMGNYNFRRFKGHPGWEYQASRGLAISVGGFVAAALGVAWIAKAWTQEPIKLPSFDKPKVEKGFDLKGGDIPEAPKTEGDVPTGNGTGTGPGG